MNRPIVFFYLSQISLENSKFRSADFLYILFLRWKKIRRGREDGIFPTSNQIANESNTNYSSLSIFDSLLVAKVSASEIDYQTFQVEDRR